MPKDDAEIKEQLLIFLNTIPKNLLQAVAEMLDLLHMTERDNNDLQIIVNIHCY